MKRSPAAGGVITAAKPQGGSTGDGSGKKGGATSDEEAALLEVPEHAVVLRHSRRGLVGEKIVEVSRSVYRADRFTLWLQICG